MSIKVDWVKKCDAYIKWGAVPSRKKNLPFGTTGIKLEDVMLREIIQTQILHDPTYFLNLIFFIVSFFFRWFTISNVISCL